MTDCIICARNSNHFIVGFVQTLPCILHLVFSFASVFASFELVRFLSQKQPLCFALTDDALDGMRLRATRSRRIAAEKVN